MNPLHHATISSILDTGGVALNQGRPVSPPVIRAELDDRLFETKIQRVAIERSSQTVEPTVEPKGKLYMNL